MDFWFVVSSAGHCGKFCLSSHVFWRRNHGWWLYEFCHVSYVFLFQWNCFWVYVKLTPIIPLSIIMVYFRWRGRIVNNKGDFRKWQDYLEKYYRARILSYGFVRKTSWSLNLQWKLCCVMVWVKDIRCLIMKQSVKF